MRKEQCRYAFEVYDETSKKMLTLNSVTYLGDIGTSRSIRIKKNGVNETHKIEIKDVQEYSP